MSTAVRLLVLTTTLLLASPGRADEPDCPDPLFDPAKVREVLALPAPQRAAALRGWFCRQASATQALALRIEVASALRAGTSAPAGLPSTEARRYLCALPWTQVGSGDSFPCPACEGRDCTGDPDFPSTGLGRFGWFLEGRRVALCVRPPSGVFDAASCDRESREVNAASVRDQRARWWQTQPLANPALALEVTGDGCDLSVHLASGGTKHLRWNPADEQSSPQAPESLHREAGQVQVLSQDGLRRLVSTRDGKVLGPFAIGPLWARDGRWFAAGAPTPIEGPAASASLWTCAEGRCKRVWSSGGAEGGLLKAGADWGAGGAVRLLVDYGPPWDCKCAAERCSCWRGKK